MTYFAEAISTASAAPEPTSTHNLLLGDPNLEGNQRLFEGIDLDAAPGTDEPPRPYRRLVSDDLHAPLNNSDVQN